MKDIPRGFVPCKAPGCYRWYNQKNVVSQGYCHKHKHLRPTTPPRNQEAQ